MFDSPIQFEEADKAIAERLPADTALKYQDILRQWTPEARQRAFFSARVMDATVLSELKRRVQQVVSGDMTSEQATRLMQEFFRGEGAPLLQRMGFLPQDQGQGKGVSELASTARLRLIFETNTRMAQEVGHYRQWAEVKEAYPYGVWHCGYAEEHRPEHLARDGKAYPFDHSIWTHSPPGGEFNCHCWREPISAEEAALRGLIPEPMDSAFQPSSLGFDPSRGMAQPVEAGKRTDSELAEKAKVPPSPERLAPILPEPAPEPAPLPQSQPTAPVPYPASPATVVQSTPVVAPEVVPSLPSEETTVSHKEPDSTHSPHPLQQHLQVGAEQEQRLATESPEKIEISTLEKLPSDQLLVLQKDLLEKLVDATSESEVQKTVGIIRWIKDCVRERKAVRNLKKLALQAKDHVKISLLETPKDLLVEAKKTIEQVQRIIKTDLAPPGKQYMGISMSNDKRAHYENNTILVPGKIKLLSIAHEIGHWLEEKNPEIREKCIKFRDSRCGASPVVPLQKLFPNGNYNPFEQTQVDNFKRVYAGKVYIKNGKTYKTEILSMGIQQLIEDPAKFKKDDKEYYSFILDILKLKDLVE